MTKHSFALFGGYEPWAGCIREVSSATFVSFSVTIIKVEMESQVLKMVDRLPDGIVRQFLRKNVHYSAAVIALAAGYIVTAVSLQMTLFSDGAHH